MEKLFLLINLVCRGRELLMEGVGSGQNESHEMRRNGEKLSWDLRIVDHTLPLPGELLPISWDPTRSQEKLDFFKSQWKNYFY